MLPDDDDEGESVKVNALGFLAGLEDESVNEGGMDVTMGNQMEMTMGRMDTTIGSNIIRAGNRTTLGGGMDVTMASSASDKMETTLGRVEPSNAGLSKTVVGGGMDITMDPLSTTRQGEGMETTLLGSEPTLANGLPDSLPNSNNS